MTLRLIMTRHAKSSWPDDAIDDHARPLNSRGRRSATAIGHWLNREGFLPDVVLSSDSARTRETWGLITAQLEAEPTVSFTPALYLASANAILEHLQRIGDASTALLLAHNPGIARAAEELAAVCPDHPQFRQYPTGATTVFDIDISSWSQLGWRSGNVRAFMVPRELES